MTRTSFALENNTGFTVLYKHVAAQTTAGLHKCTSKTRKLAYTLRAGLNRGQVHTMAGRPSNINTLTNPPWLPANHGLRNLTNHADHDSKVTIWATTSTISGNGDTGADPNQLVAIRDTLKNSDATMAANEKFVTVRSAKFAEVFRGISFAPEQGPERNGNDRH